MKIDMHCHVREGSIDSKVPIEEFIKKLQSKGIGGMLVTDHDTYNGYRHWKNTVKGRKYKDFVVLKGIEYDTLDAGHILIIMPQGVKMRLLELRGLPLSLLIDFVHHNGGICGPAHPCGEKYLSFTNTKRWQKSPQILILSAFKATFTISLLYIFPAAVSTILCWFNICKNAFSHAKEHVLCLSDFFH